MTTLLRHSYTPCPPQRWPRAAPWDASKWSLCVFAIHLPSVHRHLRRPYPVMKIGREQTKPCFSFKWTTCIGGLEWWKCRGKPRTVAQSKHDFRSPRYHRLQRCCFLQLRPAIHLLPLLLRSESWNKNKFILIGSFWGEEILCLIFNQVSFFQLFLVSLKYQLLHEREQTQFKRKIRNSWSRSISLRHRFGLCGLNSARTIEFHVAAWGQTQASWSWSQFPM